ncbi:hypothetical protein AUQ48_00245 [Kocuria flava]|uniref:Uncharacterized protein n=1 Tax=Kocuria flava TaxID=446860 RepID=A0A2N4SYB1_9MICC|nr:hypothetical protein AUQ48_00245 [Kocuria flava]
MPAAATSSVPRSGARSPAAVQAGETSRTSEPRDRETMSQRLAGAHSMPARTWASAPEPSSARTLPANSTAPGAVP